MRLFFIYGSRLSQESPQELDCKDNQDDNDSRQYSHIVIVAVNTQ